MYVLYMPIMNWLVQDIWHFINLSNSNNNNNNWFVCRMTALHQASLVGNTGIMKMLMESDASVDIKDMKGSLLFHIAQS